MNNNIPNKRNLFILCAAILCLSINSCDFSIKNPGPISAEKLKNPGTFSTSINGIQEAFAQAQNRVAFTSAAIAKQITAAGATGNCGITNAQRLGKLLPSGVNTQWNWAQRARWLAQKTVKRIKSYYKDNFKTKKVAGLALLFNGYALRLLGDNFCITIINGGPPKDNTIYFKRAEKRFTKAIEIFKNIGNKKLLHAAYSGRASVRVFLGEWKGAVSDAKKVPRSFVFKSERGVSNDLNYNYFYWCDANQPYRSYSVVNTFYEDYYKNYNDPRTAWTRNKKFPFGPNGVTPWLSQKKYIKKSSPITLSSGREMILIRAESQLRTGSWHKALELINSIRSDVGVKPWNASSRIETWTSLKRERGIQMWLEGRRLADLRRWIQNGIPGKMENMSGRYLCFPVGEDEIEQILI